MYYDLTQVLPGTPAAMCGNFQLGDILRSIDGHSLDGLQVRVGVRVRARVRVRDCLHGIQATRASS